MHTYTGIAVLPFLFTCELAPVNVAFSYFPHRVSACFGENVVSTLKICFYNLHRGRKANKFTVRATKCAIGPSE